MEGQPNSMDLTSSLTNLKRLYEQKTKQQNNDSETVCVFVRLPNVILVLRKDKAA